MKRGIKPTVESVLPSDKIAEIVHEKCHRINRSFLSDVTADEIFAPRKTPRGTVFRLRGMNYSISTDGRFGTYEPFDAACGHSRVTPTRLGNTEGS